MTGQLRVLHVTLTASRHGGGVAAYLWQLTSALAEEGVQNTIATLADDELARDERRLASPATVIGGRGFGGRTLSVAPRLWQEISRAAREADVVHLHGLRASLIWRAASAARRAGKPLVISPHGQLHPWLMTQRRGRKRIVDALFTRRDVRSAARLHAVSQPEAADIQQAYPRAQVTTVPIGIDAKPYLSESAVNVADRWPHLAGKKLLLYCSLLTPRKGLETLARAWPDIAKRFPDWHFAIAGVDADGYRPTVERAYARPLEAGSVSILGEVTEAEKAALMKQAELLVLPTLSEAFGIVITESLAAATPVLTTTGAPWAELPERGCGWWVEPTAEAIAGALEEAMSLSDAERAAMGERGRALVTERYTWEACAKQMVAMYREVAGRE